MTRYVSRLPSKAEDEYYSDTPRTITVHVEDGAPSDTGLVDSLGIPIMRLSERVPMGFRCR